MPISYAASAIADLDEIHGYISIDSPVAAKAVIARILQSIAVLNDFPALGRPGRIAGTREWTIARLPYFVVYVIHGEYDVEILVGDPCKPLVAADS